jgi:hypothetical protein
MKFLINILARISYEVWATVGFTCGMLGIPDGPVRKAVEYVACLGITTIICTAFWSALLGAIFAVVCSLSSLHAAGEAWCLMFTPPMLGIFGTFSLISTLSVMHNPSKRYQQHDAS